MAGHTWTRPRKLGLAVALVALVLAACAKHTTVPNVNATPTPTALPSGATPPPFGANGVAYLPDGGAGSAFHGIQVAHFEDTSGNLLSAPVSPAPNVNFNGSVGSFAFAADLSAALAGITVSGTSAPPFTLVQDVFGASTASLIPAGAPYDVSVAPSPYPTNCPSPSSLSPTVSDVTSVVVVGSVSVGVVGLVVGPTSGGASTGIVGLTSLTSAPPQFGCFVPFTSTTVSVPAAVRSNLALSLNSAVLLVRGLSDLLGVQVQSVGRGFQFAIQSEDASLGTGTLLRGRGGMAISPADAARAVLVQAPPPRGVTLVTGLPASINKTAQIQLPTTVHSVGISNNGQFAVVGADAGFYVLGGINSGSSTAALTLEPPFAPSSTSGQANSPAYKGCDGNIYHLQNVTSVRFSADGRYLVVLGSQPGLVCASGNNSTLLVLPFNQTTGVPPTPAPSPTPNASASPTSTPTMFTQNNIITPPTGADYMVVH